MILSYFYNLSVLGYSLKGDNEFRLYDIVGVYIIFLFFKYNFILVAYIKSIMTFKYLYYFLIWATFSLIFTLIFSVALGRILWFIQSFLYLYHFWVFFLTSVFVSIFIHELKNLKLIVLFIIIVSLIAFLIVILQNFDVIPYLWDQVYYESYLGFLSGTFGPNKIVVGMSSLIIFIFCVGLLNEKKVKINKTILLSTLIVTLIVLAISGSRTSYLGLLCFSIYYFVKNTLKFVVSITLLSLLSFFVFNFYPELKEKINATFEHRVENKIKNPNAVQEGNFDELYENLGSGRKNLSISYLEYLFQNPYIIPFGLGFNNRLLIGFSAHNIYLSLINELGILGLFLYIRWLLSYLQVKLGNFLEMEIVLKGLVFTIIITLFFGEHIYVYRPLFGLAGLFLMVTVILQSPFFYYLGTNNINENEKK